MYSSITLLTITEYIVTHVPQHKTSIYLQRQIISYIIRISSLIHEDRSLNFVHSIILQESSRNNPIEIRTSKQISFIGRISFQSKRIELCNFCESSERQYFSFISTLKIRDRVFLHDNYELKRDDAGDKS